MVRPGIACGLLLLSMCEVVFCAPAQPERRVVVDSAETAAEAIGDALPGDVIALKDGAYEDFRLAVKGNGTPKEPIEFCAQNPGKARFTGDVHIDIAGEHLIVDGFFFDQACGPNIIGLTGATHCQLSDCAFVDCGDPERAYRKIITLADHSRHNRIHHCYMQGNLSIGMGVRISKGDYQNTHNQFDHNYFKDIDGQPRHDLPDVGCDEWSTEPVRRRPVHPEDVGPEWMSGDPPR